MATGIEAIDILVQDLFDWDIKQYDFDAANLN